MVPKMVRSAIVPVNSAPLGNGKHPQVLPRVHNAAKGNINTKKAVLSVATSAQMVRTTLQQVKLVKATASIVQQVPTTLNLVQRHLSSAPSVNQAPTVVPDPRIVTQTNLAKALFCPQ